MLVVQKGWLQFVSSYAQRGNEKKEIRFRHLSFSPPSLLLSYQVTGGEMGWEEIREKEEPTK